MGDEHPVHLPFIAKDQSSGVIAKIADKAEKLGHTVDHTIHRLTEMGGAIAGIAGGLGFERMVETGRESLESISKMAKLTGTTAQNVAALRDTFEQSGLSSEALAGTITRLGKNTLKLEEGGKALAAEATRWGVNLKDGPVKAIESMAAAVQKHKIGEAEVQKLTGLSRENLGGMMELLEQGPEELAKTIDEAKRLNVHLADPAALAQFKRFHEASVKIHEAFRRISEKVIIALAPALTNMSDKFSRWIDTVNVNKFIDPLVHGMKLVVEHARLLGKIMLANSILMKTTGTGLLGGAMKLPGLVGRIAGAGGRFGGMAASGLGSLGNAAGLGGMLGPLQAVLPILLRVVGSISGIGLVAGAIYLIIKHFDALKDKLGATATAIWSALKKLGDSIDAAFSADAPLGKFVRWLGDNLISMLKTVGGMIEWIIGMLGKAIDEVNDELVSLTGHGEYAGVRRNRESLESWNKEKGEKEEQRRKSIAAFEKVGGPTAFNKLQEILVRGSSAVDKKRGQWIVDPAKQMAYAATLQERATDEQRGVFAAWKAQMIAQGFGGQVTSDPRFRALERAFGPKAPSEGGAPRTGVYQDFRNSRFDIQQKFAEGFDPDRIAIAFANDLSSMGEKRLTSGLTPAFAIR